MSGDCGHGWGYHFDGPSGPCYKCEGRPEPKRKKRVTKVSGWRIVPVGLLTQCPLSSKGWNSALDMIATAPEPDWEALAEALSAELFDSFGHVRPTALVPALKATFGSKP